MIVQSTNTGSDISNNQFGLMIPGGGVGLFDGCSKEFGSPLLGAQYGGVSSRDECNQMPANSQAGCIWRFDWFQNADNRPFYFEQVKCPAELTAKSGCVRQGDGNFPSAQACAPETRTSFQNYKKFRLRGNIYRNMEQITESVFLWPPRRSSR
ncbi:RlpA-like double-psi beta-barrel-protein domain-containing protein-containing protein [Dactylonectria estremocensis]|uniref:cellulase n=1 Tax=Dactylonectria estremocensis TaxID=1079267 RepID=A0A9P9FDJ3_9HYPO|nr:RlpA-like double-psi beta-barrel-protein domain-containing protein-containing protein [Dactylonectria estremocensis]